MKLLLSIMALAFGLFMIIQGIASSPLQSQGELLTPLAIFVIPIFLGLIFIIFGIVVFYIENSKDSPAEEREELIDKINQKIALLPPEDQEKIDQLIDQMAAERKK